jgi:hypothetical protein
MVADGLSPASGDGNPILLEPNRTAFRNRTFCKPAPTGNKLTDNKNHTIGGYFAMKRLLLIPGITALALLCSPTVHGQAVVRETTTTTAATAPLEATGTITEWGPENVIIREKDVAAPVHYGFAKRVDYVDAAGNPVAREVIRSGAPVTVRYVREGDRMLVDRVIVQRAAPVAATTTTTETTTTRTFTHHEAKEMDKLHDRIAKEERELADHPDRVHLQDDLARDRAALDAIQNGR